MGNQIDLSVFTKNKIRFQHPTFDDLKLTAGVRYICEKADAWWLLDHIGRIQEVDLACINLDFQKWKVRVNLSNCMEIALHDVDGRRVTSRMLIVEDFPFRELEIWFTDKTLLLPSEY